MSRTRPASPYHAIVVQDLTGTQRLDRCLRAAFPAWGRQTVQQLIEGRAVTVNGRDVWLCSWQVRNGDRIAVYAEPAAKMPVPATFEDVWLIAADEYLLVVNKPAGLLSHSTRWSDTPGLLELAQARFGALALFHRLDRDTSGVVLLSRGDAANRYLDAAFKTRTVVKEYLAVVPATNQLAPEGEIALRLGSDSKRRDRMRVVAKGGQWALTRYALLGQHGDEQLVRCWPVTGRTHQLRVHLAAHAAPIVGDRLYAGETRREQRLMLHGRRVTLPAADEWPARTFVAPLPPEFMPWAAQLGLTVEEL